MASNKKLIEHARKYWSWLPLRESAIGDLIDSISQGMMDPRGEAFIAGYGMVAAALDSIHPQGNGPSEEDVAAYIEIMNDVGQYDFGLETVGFDGFGGVTMDITLESGFFDGVISEQEVMLLIEASGEDQVLNLLSYDFEPSKRYKTRRELVETWLVDADRVLSMRPG